MAFERVRVILAESSRRIKLRAARSRDRAARYAGYVRRRGYASGFAAGAQAASHELGELCRTIRCTYVEAAKLAREDVSSLAGHLCEEILREECRTSPHKILPWVERALELVRSRRSIVLQLHPRYRTLLSALPPFPSSHVELRLGPSEQADEFVVISEAGEIAFRWRDAIQDAAAGGA